jgi:hypothetical protein
MLSVIYKPFMPFMLSVIMLNAFMLSVVMLSVVAPFQFDLNSMKKSFIELALWLYVIKLFTAVSYECPQ